MLLGAHESIAGGVHNSLARGKEDGCECVQVFTKSASQWSAKTLVPEDRKNLDIAKKETGITVMAAHDSYLINLAASVDENWKKSKAAFLEETRRAEFLGIQALIFHPGAHGGSGEPAGLKRIAEALGWVLDETKGAKVTLLLETTAGQGTYLGYRFEHMAEIIDALGGHERLGVCFDTCHSFSAGYDGRTVEGWHDILEDFNTVIGLERLRAFHLNDSLNDYGSRTDRHAQIGEGKIGLECFRFLVNEPRFRDVPGYLETPALPNGEDSFRKNLKVLKGLRRKK